MWATYWQPNIARVASKLGMGDGSSFDSGASSSPYTQTKLLPTIASGSCT